MPDQFTLSGQYGTTPSAGGIASGIAAITVPLLEQLNLVAKHYDSITLGTDAPTSVEFGGVVNAHVVVLKATGGKVRARITTTDGAQQAVPCDDLVIIISRGSTGTPAPATAIDLTRVPGVSTVVEVFLGQIN